MAATAVLRELASITHTSPTLAVPDLPALCPVCYSNEERTIVRVDAARARFPELRQARALRGLPCPICRPADVDKALAAQRHREMEALIAKARIPTKHATATLDDFVDHPATLTRRFGLAPEEAAKRRSWKARAQAYFDHLGEEIERGAGLSLTGSVGTGKTLLACAATRRALELGHTAMIVPERAVFDAIKASWDRDSEVCERDVLDQFTTVTWLAIDDFGVRRANEWAVEIYHGIIDARCDNGLPTSISSNLTLGTLARQYVRQMDRLALNTGIEMVGCSMRRNATQ